MRVSAYLKPELAVDAHGVLDGMPESSAGTCRGAQSTGNRGSTEESKALRLRPERARRASCLALF
jgi:hypothetical protein